MNIYNVIMSEKRQIKSSTRSRIVKALWQNSKYRKKQHNSHLGILKSNETKEKESRSKKLQWSDPKFRNKMLAIMHSRSFREKISKATKGRMLSEQTKKRISLSRLHFRNSEEAKAKMSLSHKGLKQSRKSKLKISNTLKKYLRANPSAMTRVRNLGIGRLVTQETRQKLRMINIGKKHTKKTKEKLRIARLKQIIPTKDTSIELKFQKALTENKIKYQKHVPLSGQPDIFIEPNICVFLDGCYWHGCTKCRSFSNKTVGLKGRKRDKKVNKKLKAQGFNVVRFWEHQINTNIIECVNTVKFMLN